MSSFIYIAIISLIIIFLSIRHFSVSEWLLIKRTFKRNKPVKISDFKDGEKGLIRGRIELLGATIITPISETIASYSKTTVTRSGTLLFEEIKKGDIIVYDSMGYCYIKNTGAIVNLSKGRVFEYNLRNLYAENMRSFITKKGFDPDKSTGSKYNRIKLREEFLKNGDEIHVYGKGEWRETKEFPWLKIPDKKFLYIVPAANSRVLITDSFKYTPN